MEGASGWAHSRATGLKREEKALPTSPRFCSAPIPSPHTHTHTSWLPFLLLPLCEGPDPPMSHLFTGVAFHTGCKPEEWLAPIRADNQGHYLSSTLLMSWGPHPRAFDLAKRQEGSGGKRVAERIQEWGGITGGTNWSRTGEALNRPSQRGPRRKGPIWGERDERKWNRAGGTERGRLTLKSLMASVCRASEGRVVRGERRPSLQKLKASLLHKADSGKREVVHTHTHTQSNPRTHTHTHKIEFQSHNDNS